MTQYKQIFNPLSKNGFNKVNQEAQIDAALDENSENAVQNKVVTDAINGKQDVIDDLDAIRDGAALGATALQEHQDISGKQDKDNNADLTTTSKSIVGAINEVAATTAGIGTMVNNQLVVAKRAIVTDKRGDPMNEYTLKCLLNGSTMRVITLRETAADEYPDANRFVWHKTAAQKNRAVNIVSIGASAGKGVLKLTIYDAARQRSEEHYVCFKFDTPSEGTFLFSTTCQWPIETRCRTNELYSYLIIPDDFVGDITVQLVRINVQSGGNIRIVWPTSDSDATPKRTKLLINDPGDKLPVSDGSITDVEFYAADNLYGTPLTASQFITPFGYYHVDIIYDFGTIAVGDRLQDNVVNDTQLHDIGKRLNTMADTDADTIVRLLQTIKPALKVARKEGNMYVRHPRLDTLADYNPRLVLMKLNKKCHHKKILADGTKKHYLRKKWVLDLQFKYWSETGEYKKNGQTLWNTTAAHHTAGEAARTDTDGWYPMTTHSDAALFAYIKNGIKSAYYGIAIRIDNPRYAGNDTALYYQGQQRYLYSLPAVMKVNWSITKGYTLV